MDRQRYRPEDVGEKRGRGRHAPDVEIAAELHARRASPLRRARSGDGFHCRLDEDSGVDDHPALNGTDMRRAVSCSRVTISFCRCSGQAARKPTTRLIVLRLRWEEVFRGADSACSPHHGGSLTPGDPCRVMATTSRASRALSRFLGPSPSGARCWQCAAGSVVRVTNGLNLSYPVTTDAPGVADRASTARSPATERHGVDAERSPGFGGRVAAFGTGMTFRDFHRERDGIVHPCRVEPVRSRDTGPRRW